MKRTDWMSAVSIPLGIIPAGSGNAMSTACGSPNAVRVHHDFSSDRGSDTQNLKAW
jgi:diacylglycerol kinase family enzyme